MLELPALMTRMARITKGSTKAVVRPSSSSNKARTKETKAALFYALHPRAEIRATPGCFPLPGKGGVSDSGRYSGLTYKRDTQPSTTLPPTSARTWIHSVLLAVRGPPIWRTWVPLGR